MKRKVNLFTLICLFVATNAAYAEEYNAVGTVKFFNLQALLADIGAAPFSAVLPLTGKQVSDFNGQGLQTGAITADSALQPATEDQLAKLEEGLQIIGQEIDFDVDSPVFTFTGVQGPNPKYGGRALQLIIGRGGQVHTTWRATFFIFFSGDEAILVGDGDFTVVGGTGQNANATGSFRTIFITVPTSLDLDASEADYWQFGEINR